MLQQIGNTDIMDAFGVGSLRLKFLDGPLALAWKHCGITSDFLGDFYSARTDGGSIKANEIRHNIAYLVNELLENAVKFRSAGDIVIDTLMVDGAFRLCIANLISADTALGFQEVLGELQGRNPSELLIERIEQNAADPTSSGSGLGLLTLMSDYGVEIGWNFLRPAGENGPVRLETHAVLPLP